ncbi:chymotrypsinogen A-like [Euwallacea fornicatus]|uniref:chymotrypsinogen A-like n=1 Tax=Euwallacea fornicatus TaxID=995702 RepID=UPI00338D4FBB
MGVFLFINAFLIGLVQSQTLQTFCTLPSLCNDGSIIDPRILTNGAPGSNPPRANLPGSNFPGLNSVGAISGANIGTNIITPPGSTTNCPAGYISCSNITCGTPSAQPGSQDGFATPNAFPWQVFIRNNLNLAVNNGYAGGGVLLDPYTVLTAAHKVTNLTSISVLVGVYNIGNLSAAQAAQVSQVWIHTNYNQTYLKNDVAILRLATTILINTNAMPICLPLSGSNYAGSSGTSCVVSGWGQTSFTVADAPTQVLRQVHVPIVTNSQCVASYNAILGTANTAAYLDLPNEICAGGQAQLDTCTQDGGSPLVCPSSNGPFSLVGLVLWGKNCGQPGRYGVYLNVPSYVNWIQCTQQCIQGNFNCLACPATQFL